MLAVIFERFSRRASYLLLVWCLFAQTVSQAAPLNRFTASTGLVYSQEYMRHFFSDNDDRIRPIPGRSIVFAYSRHVSESWDLTSALSFPTGEEIVRKDGEADFVYYYPKLLSISAELTFMRMEILQESFKENEAVGLPDTRLSFMIGGGLLLSQRIWKDIFPNAGLLLRIPFSQSSFFNCGLIYSGNVERGAWTFPFGLGYVF